MSKTALAEPPEQGPTRSRCTNFTPNDWVEYVDTHIGIVLHIDEFFNPFKAEDRGPPPGGWTK